MYIILTYDIGVERVDKIRKYLKRYLHWVQNSVLEGELTKADYRKIKKRLNELIEPDHDNIRIYKLRSDKYLDTEEIGLPKTDIDTII